MSYGYIGTLLFSFARRIGSSVTLASFRQLICGRTIAAFDNIERTDTAPADHLISRFDYLNISARPEAVRVRQVINGMLSRYPKNHRTNLTLRIRSRDDGLHSGAVFELVLHELLICRNFRIIAVEPKLPNGRSPDFLVEAPDGSRFFLEATIAWGTVGADAGAHRRMRDVLQAVDRVESSDFFLSVHHHGFPASQAPVGRLRREVQNFVNGLDYEETVNALNAEQNLPIYNFEHDGLHLHIEALPKKNRQPDGRAIGVRMLPGGVVTPHLAIKAAVEGKAGRYGEFDIPYVIAVSAFNEFANERSVIDALFGTEAVEIDRYGQEQWIRNRDGVWYGPNGPVYTRVSAVLSTTRLSAWDLGQRSMQLIFNPWAKQPLPNVPLGADVVKLNNTQLLRTQGFSIGEILGLPDDWPE